MSHSLGFNLESAIYIKLRMLERVCGLYRTKGLQEIDKNGEGDSGVESPSYLRCKPDSVPVVE